ncbi:expressed unknown protein [Seminavis robusta]|uniref:Uncharacterized protein n=1 Tax=Seminavis robusta TaxID=568900 RepID=A0A9N8ED38_9STRA|nr:expressed unknown protein [Seminavis robusta]|eukprot:Sro769_g199750.1 n/a (1185) ;mRNA; r:6102-9656
MKSVRKMMDSLHNNGSFHRSLGHIELSSDGEDDFHKAGYSSNDSSDSSESSIGSENSFACLLNELEDQAAFMANKAEKAVHDSEGTEKDEAVAAQDNDPLSPQSPTSVVDVMEASSMDASAASSLPGKPKTSPKLASSKGSPSNPNGKKHVLGRAQSFGNLLIDTDEEGKGIDNSISSKRRAKKGAAASKRHANLRKSQSLRGLRSIEIDVDKDLDSSKKREKTQSAMSKSSSSHSIAKTTGASKKGRSVRKSKSMRSIMSASGQEKPEQRQAKPVGDSSNSSSSSRRRTAGTMKKSKSLRGLRSIDTAAQELSSTGHKSTASHGRISNTSKGNKTARKLDATLTKAKSLRSLRGDNDKATVEGPANGDSGAASFDQPQKSTDRADRVRKFRRSNSMSSPFSSDDAAPAAGRRGEGPASTAEEKTSKPALRKSNSLRSLKTLKKSNSLRSLRGLKMTSGEEPSASLKPRGLVTAAEGPAWTEEEKTSKPALRKSNSLRSLKTLKKSNSLRSLRGLKKPSGEEPLASLKPKINPGNVFNPLHYQVAANGTPPSPSSTQRCSDGLKKSKSVRTIDISNDDLAPSSLRREGRSLEDKNGKKIRRRAHSASRIIGRSDDDTKASASSSNHSKRHRDGPSRKKSLRSIHRAEESASTTRQRRSKDGSSNGAKSSRSRSINRNDDSGVKKKTRSRSRTKLVDVNLDSVGQAAESVQSGSVDVVSRDGRSQRTKSRRTGRIDKNQGSKSKENLDENPVIKRGNTSRGDKGKTDANIARPSEREQDDEASKRGVEIVLRKCATNPKISGFKASPILTVPRRRKSGQKSPESNLNGGQTNSKKRSSLRGFKDVRNRLGHSLHSSSKMLNSPKGSTHSVASHSIGGGSISSLTVSSRMFTQDDFSISSSQRSPFRRSFSSPRLYADTSIDEDDETSRTDFDEHPVTSRWESLRTASADCLPVAPDHDLSTVGGDSTRKHKAAHRWSTGTKIESNSISKILEVDNTPVPPNHDTSSYCGSVGQQWDVSHIHLPGTPSYSAHSYAGMVSELTPGTYMADHSRNSRDSSTARSPLQAKFQRDDEHSDFNSWMSSLSNLLLHAEDAAGCNDNSKKTKKKDGAPQMVRRHSFDSLSYASYSCDGGQHEELHGSTLTHSENDSAPKMPSRRTSGGSSVYYIPTDRQLQRNRETTVIPEEA